ncbi:PREDICTED: uncharacterized protein LOC104806929 [Tarenaya hassleriana]|uniref:uncharacterized protein LOC104806929 n=1 Tax=Tarenaya hassleriana TaxID=28532 RepID=UPI00053C65E4|nr:PREDICTED: uncharacterized protein LOC104806929 [Tarenaya hassleriana]
MAFCRLAISLAFLVFSHVICGMCEETTYEFECVDISRQPAFQHPSLKNHKIQMRPSVELEKMLEKQFPKIFSNLSFDESDEPCPNGMVPIPKRNNETASLYLMDDKFPGQHFATIETKNDGSVYVGAVAEISIQSPHVKLNQYSKAQIWVENGPTSLQAGWAVHPRIYGDSRPRFTTYWTGDGYKSTGCYNVVCPGFVQTSSYIFPGKPYPQISQYGVTPVYATILITKDPTTKNWLLYHDYKNVGYWPREIVPSMDVGATRVRYGGNTYVSPDGISPQMGDGNFPNVDISKCANFRRNSLILEGSAPIDIDGNKMTKYTDSDTCFKLKYFGVEIKEFGPIFAYGGPGGQCGV